MRDGKREGEEESEREGARERERERERERDSQNREGRLEGVGWQRGVREEPGKGKGMLRVLAWTSASTAVASHEPPKL